MLLVLAAATMTFADELSDYVNKERVAKQIPGLVLATIKNGKVDQVVSSGLASLDLNVPVKRESVFEIGSLTKAFTAELVMMLVEEKKVGLDEKIAKYLEDCPESWKDITVRRLLTHTSGLPDYTSLRPALIVNGLKITYPEIFELVKALDLQFPPGEKFQYSNTNYYLLGQIIENVTKEEFSDYLEEKILKPLEMSKTGPQKQRSIIENRTAGYIRVGNTYVVSPFMDGDAAWAAGYLVSTIDDMAKWDKALLEGKLLKSESYAEMYKRVPIKDGVSTYGFGWDVSEMAGHKVMQHGGGTGGFSTYIMRLPDDKVSVVVLSNLAEADVASIAHGAARIVLPALVENPILDPDPKITKAHREIIEKMADGTVQRTPFSKEAADELFPTLVALARQQLLSFGKLEKFEVLEHKHEPKMLTRRYRMVFEKARLQLVVRENEEHKIVTIFMRPD